MSSDTPAPARQEGVAGLALRAVRWRLPVLLLVAMPMVALGIWQLSRQADVYEAVAIVSVAPESEAASSDLLKLSAERLAVQLSSGTTMDRVAQRTGVTAPDLDSRVDVSTPTDTANVRIAVRLTSAEEAARLANAISAEGRSFDASDPSAIVEMTSPAEVPDVPVSPPRGLLTALVLLIGLGVGLAVAMLAERLQPRLRTLEDCERSIGAPVLGVLPRTSMRARNLSDTADDGQFGRALRLLRSTFLAEHAARSRPRRVAVVGLNPGAGATTVATSLALALAKGGTQTTLVDGDLEAAAVAQRVGVEPSPGLVEMLTDDLPLPLASKELFAGTLVVIPARQVDQPGDLLARELPRVLTKTDETGDVLLVDTAAPLHGVAGSVVVAQMDAAVVVVARDSPARQGRRMADVLTGLGVPVLGVVVDHGGSYRWPTSRAGEDRTVTAGAGAADA